MMEKKLTAPEETASDEAGLRPVEKRRVLPSDQGRRRALLALLTLGLLVEVAWLALLVYVIFYGFL
jgi:hypothetical protein